MTGEQVVPAAEQTLAVTDGRIVGVGVTGPAHMTLDAKGRALLPGFIDCHTHTLWAGDRLAEHLMRLAGASYQDIARAGGGVNENFTVRKISFGEGVERVFPVYSPMIDSIKVVRRGAVRRAKLYYLRGRTGKSARIAEKQKAIGLVASAAEKAAAAEAGRLGLLASADEVEV